MNGGNEMCVMTEVVGVTGATGATGATGVTVATGVKCVTGATDVISVCFLLAIISGYMSLSLFCFPARQFFVLHTSEQRNYVLSPQLLGKYF